MITISHINIVQRRPLFDNRKADSSWRWKQGSLATADQLARCAKDFHEFYREGVSLIRGKVHGLSTALFITSGIVTKRL